MKILGIRNVESLAIVRRCLHDDIFGRSIEHRLVTHGQTDGHRAIVSTR